MIFGCDTFDVILKAFIEHCQICKFIGMDIIFIMPFYVCYRRCEILDLNIVFKNVKLRILLTYVL